jgi:hypothetical protein
MVNKLLLLFDIRTSEAWTVSRMLLFSFFQDLGLAFLMVTANTLFVSSQDVKDLPIVYIITAGVLLVIEFGYMKLEKRARISQLILGILSIITFFLLIFNITIKTGSGAGWIIFGLFVFEKVVTLTCGSEFDKIKSILFDVRQSKRLFGLLGSAKIPAGVIGAILASTLINFINSEDLLLISIVPFSFSLYIFYQISRRHQQKLGVKQDEEEAIKNTEKSFGQKLLEKIFLSKYVFLLSIFMFLLVCTSLFVEFTFLKEVESTFDSEQQLANFFGFFFAAGSLISFIIKSFATSRILNKFGIKVVLNIFPLGLLLLFSSTLLIGFDLHNELFIIGFFMLFKDIVTSSFSEPGFFTLFQTLNSKIRIKAFNIVSIVENTSYAVAGAVLFLGIGAETSFGLPSVIIFALLVIIFASFSLITNHLINKEYHTTVATALKKKLAEGRIFDVKDHNSLNILYEKLTSQHAGEVLYSIDVLSKADRNNFADRIPILLQNPILKVREEVLKHIEEEKIQVYPSVLLDIINSDPDLHLRSLALRAYSAITEGDVYEEISSFLQDPEEEIRMGAIVALIKHGGINGVMSAGELLLDLQKSEDKNKRKFAAQIVGEIGIQNFYHPLLELIKDPHLEVVKVALVSASRIKNPRLIPEMVLHLDKGNTFDIASRALVKTGDKVIPVIEKYYYNEITSVKMARRICFVAGRIGGDQAIRFLKNCIKNQNPDIKHQALLSLQAAGFKAEKEENEILQIIDHEISEATFLLIIKTLLPKDEVSIFLRNAIEFEIERITDRCLLLFSYIYDANKIQRVRNSYFVKSQELKANAIELLDLLLKGEIKKKFLTLIESSQSIQKAQILSGFYPVYSNTLEVNIQRLISKNYKFIHNWTKAIAMELVLNLELSQLKSSLTENLGVKENIIKEIAVKALYKFDKKYLLTISEFLPISYQFDIYSIIQKMKQKNTDSRLFIIEKVLLLKTVQIFSNTSEEILTDIAEVIEEVEVEKGETIFRKGDSGNCMYVIYEGEVKIHDKETIFATLKERDFFGEFSLLDPEPRSATVTATKDTFLLKLDQETFFEIMADRIEVARGILHILVNRLRNQNILISDLQNKLKNTETQEEKIPVKQA